MSAADEEQIHPSIEATSARRPTKGVDRNTAFSVIASTVAALIGAVVGFFGAQMATNSQIAHDDKVRHSDQLKSACVESVQLMEHETSALNSVWAKASLNNPDSLQALSDSESVRTKLEDAVANFYLVGSSAGIREMQSFMDHDFQARNYLYTLLLGNQSNKNDLLRQITVDIDAAGNARERLAGDCRSELAH